MPNWSPASLIRYFITGFAMGSADVVPGVSGGTIAFIFGVYEELVDAIKVSSGKALKLFMSGKVKEAFAVVPFGFLIPLATGIFTAIFSLAHLLSNLLETQPVMVWSFFFGLVASSIILMAKIVKKWNQNKVLAFIGAAITAFFIVAMVPVETPATLPAFFISGALAICAMILPGVSGSFLLILMGKYQQILQAASQRDLIVLGTVAFGAVIGLALFSRLLSYLFKKYHDMMVAILTGLMLGSLRKIWPWKIPIEYLGDKVIREANYFPGTFDQQFLIALCLALVGAILILALSNYGKKVKPS